MPKEVEIYLCYYLTASAASFLLSFPFLRARVSEQGYQVCKVNRKNQTMSEKSQTVKKAMYKRA